MSGADAGEITEIQVPPGPSGKFRVKVEVLETLHPLVRSDSIASIQTEGLVGGTFLQIGTGGKDAPQAPEGGTIPGREPFELSDMIDQMGETVNKVNATIDNVKVDIEATVRAMGKTAETARALIEESKPTWGPSRAPAAIAGDARVVMTNLRNGQGALGKLASDNELYLRARDTMANAQIAVENMKEASETAKATMASFQGTDKGMQGALTDFRETMSNARDAMGGLSENMDALKRNFLLRGFFNRRGYFELDDLSASEYRQGVLEATDRQALRVWVRADLLFSHDGKGIELLTDEGKARLDWAIASFLDYPRDTPLIVEGYFPTGTRDQQHLASRERAAQVREYLVARFHLNPNATGLIPLGDDAVGSPDGGAWDGIALAAFPRIGS